MLHLRSASLGTHRANYSKARFYDDLQTHIRFKTPAIPTDRNNNEQLIFRRNVLKKYMHNVLFLDTRTRREGKVIEQGLFGIAAGISMLFATVVLFLSQSLYGPLTLPVFLALVIGYMFKDRIKEMLRVYLSRKVSSLLFDHKTRIYSDPRHPIGYCRESFDFVDEAKVPDRIMKIRDRDHMTEIQSEWVSEGVLRYRKRIKLSSRAIAAAYRDIDTDGINDIMRLNVAEFTRHGLHGQPVAGEFIQVFAHCGQFDLGLLEIALSYCCIEKAAWQDDCNQYIFGIQPVLFQVLHHLLFPLCARGPKGAGWLSR